MWQQVYERGEVCSASTRFNRSLSSVALAERGEHGFGQQAPGLVRHCTGALVVTSAPMASQLHLSLCGSSFESGPVYCSAL